jgi:tetratricopeptide (TPR) repeat protein
MAMGQSDWAAAVPLLEESIELFRESGRRYDEVVSLSYLSFVYLRLGELEKAGNLAREALRVAEALAEPRTVAFSLMALADVDWARGDHEQALATYDEAVAISRATGDPLLVVDAVYHSGMAAFQASDRDRARVAFEEALARAAELHEVPHMAAAQFMLAQVAILSGDPRRAQDHGRASLKYYSELEDNRSRARCLVILAGAAAATGRTEDAARMLGLAGALRGGDDVDAFETSVLDLHVAELQTLLGEDRLTALEREGAGLADATQLAKVVSPGTEE